MTDIINRACAVLDHGFVRVVDAMGGDAAIVQAARVSYGDGTKKRSEDRGLIRYLMRHEHTSPFEMCEIKLHLKMPIFVARQWVRHRTASMNEVSGRYSVMPEEFYVPELDQIATQSIDNKQGRGEPLALGHAEWVQQGLHGNAASAFRDYKGRVASGVARELARIDLPLSTYTEFYWKIDLRNLLHFLKLRLDSHAQYEIRAYAQVIHSIVEAWVPLTAEAFDEYILGAATLSRTEVAILRAMLRADLTNVATLRATLSSREREAFDALWSTELP